MTHNNSNTSMILLIDGFEENLIMEWDQNYNFIKLDHPNSIK